MKVILKQLLQLFAALAAVYGVLLAVSLVLVPRAQFSDGLDTARANASLYMTEPKYVFLAREQLNTPADKVILLGASNVVAGFRARELKHLVPGVQIHNLGVGGSNMRQVSQVVDLVHEVQSPSARRHNTFVIGLWYGLMADDSVRWHTPDRHAGDTDIDIERYRYGFFKRTETGAAPLLPPQHLDIGTTLIHPWLAIDKLARDMTKSARQVLLGKAPELTDEQRNATVLNEAQRQYHLQFWSGYMGQPGVTEAGFKDLRDTVRKIAAQGGRVVLVDLPVPPWHAKGSPHHAQYAARRDALFAQLAADGSVVLLDMQGLNGDDDFSDEVHPKPRVTAQWSQELAAALKAHEATPNPRVVMRAPQEPALR